MRYVLQALDQQGRASSLVESNDSGELVQIALNVEGDLRIWDRTTQAEYTPDLASCGL